MELAERLNLLRFSPRDLFLLSGISSFEACVKRFLETVYEKFYKCFWGYVERSFPKLYEVLNNLFGSSYNSKVVFSMETMPKAVINRAYMKYFDTQPKRYHMKNGDVKVDIEEQNFKEEKTFLDSTIVHTSEHSITFRSVSRILAKKHMDRFIECLSEVIKETCVFELGHCTKMIERVNVNNCVIMEHWRSKAKFIVANMKSPKGTNAYILDGPPGVGKTTFVKYLASIMKMNVFSVRNPADFIYQRFPPFGAIYVFDDFDKVTTDTKKLLSMLDGLDSIRSNLYIFACNDVSILESNHPTLTRAGRTTTLNFTKPTEADLKAYRAKFCSEAVEIRKDDTFPDVQNRYLALLNPIPVYS